LKPDDDLCAVILERARLVAEVTPRERLQFVLNAATFLNGRRWEDAPPQSGPVAPAANANMVTTRGAFTLEDALGSYAKGRRSQ